MVNFSRSLARQLRTREEPITVNCICPGMVDTALVPDTLVESVPKEMQTPMSTIIKAIEGFLEDTSVNGVAAECTGEEVLYRPVMRYGNKAAEFVVGGVEGAMGEAVGRADVKKLREHMEEMGAYYAKMEV